MLKPPFEASLKAVSKPQEINKEWPSADYCEALSLTPEEDGNSADGNTVNGADIKCWYIITTNSASYYFVE